MKIGEKVPDEGCCSGGSDCDCSNIPDNKMCVRATPPHGFDVKALAELTSDPNYICKCCGRTANDAEDLCSPTLLKA